jgi:uncharacterized protein (TIGR03089 family)
MLPALLPVDALADANRPLLTYCDDATGERVELTASALGGWAARTAGLLRLGCGLDAGDRAAVLLPPHWQTAAVLLGAWSVGVEVSYRPWATAGLDRDRTDEPLDALFVSRQRLRSWLEEVPAAEHRFVLNLTPEETVPEQAAAGYRDYVAEALGYPAQVPGFGPIERATASPDGTTYRQWGEVARGIADRLGLRATDRLLVDASAHEQPVAWLLAPLSVGASVVLCANLDRARLDDRIAAEAITQML